MKILQPLNIYLASKAEEDLVSVSTMQRGTPSPFLIALDQGDVLLKWNATPTFSSQKTYRIDQITQAVLLICRVYGDRDRTRNLSVTR